jgi:hypothetical protein
MSERLHIHLRSTRALLVGAALAGALIGILLVSAHASASNVNYCANWIATGSECEGPSHNLTADIAWDDTGSGGYVCDTATTASGNDVAGWGCGWGEAETCYNGSQPLHGWILNDSGDWLYMNGTEYYSVGCP